MHLGIIAAAAVSLVAPAAAIDASPGEPSNWPACSMRHQVTFISRLEDMPASIQADFRGRIGDIAGPGEAFNSGDETVVGDTTPTQRFLRGVQSGDYWFIWYEHGGFAFHRHVLAYAIRFNGTAALSGEPRRARPNERVETSLEANLTGDTCVATDAILDSVFPSEEF
jgi:hypothetical protein